MATFDDLDLLPSLAGTLRDLKISTPTEIQARAIPELVAGRSVVGVAETGSGKTMAYVLPILHRLKGLELGGDPVKQESAPRAVVLVPSRELGEQVAKVFKSLTHDTRLRVRTSLGGVEMVVTRDNIKGAFEVLVATPGRLLQLLHRKLIDLADVRLVVLDEADLLLDMGFLPDADEVVAATPAGRQVALFTATLPPGVTELVERRLKSPVTIRSRGSHRVVPSLRTENRRVVDGKRFEHLKALLAEKTPGSTLVFTNTREQCDKVVELIRGLGHSCEVFRGEMHRVERRQNLKAFREGDVQLLVATDLGARGLDIEHVARVINYHMPSQMDAYLHRVGRTARAGRAGLVVNLVTERDQPMIDLLARVAPPAP